MKFAIITHVIHKNEDEKLYAYEPYVREMNLWCEHVAETKIVAPFSTNKLKPIDTFYNTDNITISRVPYFDITSILNIFKSIIAIPVIVFRIFNVMLWADHIHLRCPGNMGLLGTLVQILFPNKTKTVKYAGNWDPKSKQPWSYRLQKWIVSNTVLTKKCKVLVYGDWKDQSKNIIPFFTASYESAEIIEIPKKNLEEVVKFIFVGTFSKGKQPLTSIKVVEKLYKSGKDVILNMYGNGTLFEECTDYIKENNLEDIVFLHGNQSKETVKKAFQKSHFLIFISKSEGWPKVVAEAMFWSCLPISTSISCIPNMLGFGARGSIVKNNIEEIIGEIEKYFSNIKLYEQKLEAAKKWSQSYTLDKFEQEIKQLLIH